MSSMSTISEVDILDIFYKYESLEENDLIEKYNQIQKSNYIKNILRAFYTFILNEGDDVVIESLVSIFEDSSNKNVSQIRKEFNAFIKNKRLNQSTLVSLLKSKRFNHIFNYYLCYYSNDWILKGSVSDIDTHVLCISFLKKCLTSEYLINEMKVYKKQ